MSGRAALAELLEQSGVPAALIGPLARYGAMLLDANRMVNLTGAKSPGELTPHLLDSLSVAPHVQDSLVDVGSGGGLPAIPLAIANGIPVTMIDATAKKAAFLREAVTALGLRAAVVARRAEDAGRDAAFREQYACGTARAVAAAPAVAELLLPFVRVGGVAVLQRGRIEPQERNALADAVLMLGGRIENEIALEGERRIILVRKVAPTPSRFPRRNGVPEKRPLCMSP